MGTKRQKCLSQIEELEEHLTSLEVRQEELSYTDMEVSQRLHHLQGDNRENLQPLMKELDEKERAIAFVLEKMREHQEQHEKMMKRKHRDHQSRVKEIQEKIRQQSTETRQTEERFCEEQTQLRSQTLDLEQQILDQRQQHQSELEMVKRREKERLDRELERVALQREREVGERVKEHLLEQWSQEQTLHRDCVCEVSTRLHQQLLMWDNISDMNIQHQIHQMITAQRRAHHRQETRENHRLQESIRRSSRQILQLNSQKMCLNQKKETSQHETHKLRAQLKGEYVQTSEEVKQQRSEKACLEAELKSRKNQRKNMEAGFRAAVNALETLIQDPQKTSVLVQQLSDLFSTEVSDAEFSLFSVRQFHGPDASEQNVREESERLMLTITDPEFLLKCVRKNDVSSSPCCSWHRPPAPNHHPSAHARCNKGTPTIWIP